MTKIKKNIEIIITPPLTLIEKFAANILKKKIFIGSQNCYHKDPFSSNTSAVSAHMIKSVGAKYTLIGHSDNRAEGDNDYILKRKFNLL